MINSTYNRGTKQAVTLFVVLVIFVVIIEAKDESDNEEVIDLHSQTSLNLRNHFKLPRLFDFEYFKSLFQRHYDSFMEEMVRRKLYLCRAFRVFISAVNYKYKRASSYLAINHMSDWTPDEVSHLYIENHDSKQQNTVEVSTANTLNLALDIADGENKLLDIEKHKNEPEFKELFDELDLMSSNSKSGVETREISLNSLVREPSDTDKTELSLDELDIPESQGWFGILNTQDKNDEPSFINFVIGTARDFLSPQTEAEKNLPDVVLIDHRNSSCYQKTRSQGKCGSCYAFASIALYEWLFCQKTGKLIQFSEQYVVDCGHRLEMKGCRGAKFTEVSRFVQKFGLDIRGNYPYIGGDHECPFKLEDPVDIMGYMRVQDDGFTHIPLPYVGSHLKENPFLMNINVNGDFSEYGGGVHNMDSWQNFNVVHSVLVVGMGREDGQSYWLIRNSLSENWGEKGHYKLNKRTTCINTPFGFILKANFKSSFEENLNEKYDGSRVIQMLIEHPTIWDPIERRETVKESV